MGREATRLQRLDAYVRVRAQCHTNPETDCLIWDSTVNGDNQPVARIQGKVRAVRSWLRAFFKVDIAYTLPCDTPCCVNPLHGVRRQRTIVAS